MRGVKQSQGLPIGYAARDRKNGEMVKDGKPNEGRIMDNVAEFLSDALKNVDETLKDRVFGFETGRPIKIDEVVQRGDEVTITAAIPTNNPGTQEDKNTKPPESLKKALQNIGEVKGLKFSSISRDPNRSAIFVEFKTDSESALESTSTEGSKMFEGFEEFTNESEEQETFDKNYFLTFEEFDRK